MSPGSFLRGLLLVLLCGGLTLWASFNLGEGDYIPLVLAVGAVAWCLLLQARPLILAAAILCFFGHLTLPGIPDQLNLTLLAGLYFLPLIPLQIASRQGIRQVAFPHFLLLGYGLWLLVLIQVHGIGLLQFGGGQIGGADYFRSFAAIGFFFACLTLPLPAKWWTPLLITSLLILAVPSAADLIIQFKPDLTEPFRKVIDLPPMSVNLSQTDEMANTGFVNRFITLAFTSILAVALIFCLRPTDRIFSLNRGLPWLAFLILLLLVNGLAGSREALFNILGLVLIFLILNRAISPVTLLVSGIVGALGTLMVSLFFVKHLPMAIQRVFSVLPWADVSHQAASDAAGTWVWRKELWALGWSEVPSHLLVGKGFSYDYHSYAFGRLNALDWAFMSSSFHLSYLDFLIKTGLPGLLLFYAFLLFSALRHWKIQKSEWKHPRLRHFHLVFFALFLAGIATFLTLYGDTGRSVLRFAFYVGILEALRLSDISSEAPQDELSPA